MNEEQGGKNEGRMFCVDCTRTIYNPSSHTARQMPAQFGPPGPNVAVRCIPCYRKLTGVPYSDYYRENHKGELYPVDGE
jgi:hypothetical protein